MGAQPLDGVEHHKSIPRQEQAENSTAMGEIPMGKARTKENGKDRAIADAIS